MRWLLALPLIPLLFCGGMCLAGLLVAFIVGRKIVDPKADETTAAPHSEEVG